MKLSLSRIAEFTNASGNFAESAVAQGYSIDSRTVKPGELFFAIRGEKLDGHDYVEAALAAGAIGAVVARDCASKMAHLNQLLVVDDTLQALQSLAANVRRVWGKPLLAITGSAGKTTTKELAARVLGTQLNVLKSQGNLNNHFGLPLQLLKLEPEHDIAVIEMGMNHPGEITSLCAIAAPDAGVVTCVAPVHIEFFRSVSEIARAKKELIDALPANGTAVLNADDEYVSRFADRFAGRVVMFGVNRPADVRAQAVEQLGISGSRFQVIKGDRTHEFELPLIGSHNVYNALAAIAAGVAFGVSLEAAREALRTAAPADKRGEVIEVAGATVINDSYNSNPKALESMIDALAGMRVKGRKIVVGGEMLELGSSAEDLHRRCGAHAARKKIDVVLGVRGAARHIVEGAREAGGSGIVAEFLATPQDAGEWLARNVRPGDAVLLKASRGVRLENALQVWKERKNLVNA